MHLIVRTAKMRRANIFLVMILPRPSSSQRAVRVEYASSGYLYKWLLDLLRDDMHSLPSCYMAKIILQDAELCVTAFIRLTDTEFTPVFSSFLRASGLRCS